MVWCRKGGPSYIRTRDRSVQHGLLSVPLCCHCCEVSVSLPLIQQNDHQLARKVTAEGINLKLGASDKPKIAVKNDIILDFQRRPSEDTALIAVMHPMGSLIWERNKPCLTSSDVFGTASTTK